MADWANKSATRRKFAASELERKTIFATDHLQFLVVDRGRPGPEPAGWTGAVVPSPPPPPSHPGDVTTPCVASFLFTSVACYRRTSPLRATQRPNAPFHFHRTDRQAYRLDQEALQANVTRCVHQLRKLLLQIIESSVIRG